MKDDLPASGKGVPWMKKMFADLLIPVRRKKKPLNG